MPKDGGKGRGKSTASGKGYWKCFGCQYMVPHGELYCNGCGHQPPPAVSCPAASKPKGGGKGNGKNANAKTPDATLEKKLKAAEAELQKSNKQKSALDAEVKRLKESAAATPPPANASSTAAHTAAQAAPELEVLSASKEVQAKIKSTRDKIKEYKAIPIGLREELFQHRGGFDAVIAALEKEVAELGVEKRSSFPLKDQLDGAASHEKRMAKLHEQAAEKLETLLKQQEELASLVKSQLEATSKLEGQHQSAKAELCELTARFAEEQRAKATGQVSASTAADRPQTQANPEELQSVQYLLSCLAKADAAAVLGPGCKSQAELEAHTARLRSLHARMASPPPSFASVAERASAMPEEDAADMDFDIDDEQAQYLAEAATPAIADEQAEARAERVAKAKAGLKGTVCKIVAKRLKVKK